MVSGVWKLYSPYTSFSLSGFSSQFNGSSSGWVKRPGAAWNAGSTTYYTLGTADKVSSVSYNKTLGNFTYQARMKRITKDTYWGGQAGLVVRGSPSFDSVNDWRTSYEFIYSSYFGDFTIWRGLNGTWTALKGWTMSPAIVKNGWNTLKVVANGSGLQFYINGNLVWLGSDSKIASGQVGLWTWGGGSSAERFDVDWATLTTVTGAPAITQPIEAGQIELPMDPSAPDSGKYLPLPTP
jgi:hypothetical protein